LVNRGELFWDELAGSGSMYVNKDGSITDFLVDVKKLPQNLYKNN
jgi:ribosomal protein L24E